MGRVTYEDYLQAATELDVALSDEPIHPGDMYLAGRNTGIHLLTCDFISIGVVYPIENAYVYDIHECYKIIM